jgi:hypothetical protein
MFRKTLWLLILAALPLALVAAQGTPQNQKQTRLSAAAIVDKNVAARGGLQAWRGVQTMTLSGKIGAGGNQRATLNVPSQMAPSHKGLEAQLPTRPKDETLLPITIYLARARKMRIELQFRGDTALQVFDGTNGWKLRPYLNRKVVEGYTEDELKSTSGQADLDGPLVDYAAKGSKVELVGTEQVEGRNTYKIKVTMKNGQSENVWIDAETFLETKIDGQPRRLDGTMHPVEVYYRDYRNVSGLQIPFTLETRVLSVAKTTTGLRDTPVPPEKMIFDKIVVNPKLEASLFTKPEVLQSSVAKPTPTVAK